MGIFILKKGEQMIAGIPLNRSYTRAQSDGKYGGTIVSNEVVSGSGTSYTLAHTPTLNSERIFGSGARLTGGGVDYTISGPNITLINSATAGTILADYAY